MESTEIHTKKNMESNYVISRISTPESDVFGFWDLDIQMNTLS